MKINDIKNQTLEYLNRVKNQTEKLEANSPHEKERTSSYDNVIFSTRSKDMQKLYEIIKETPDVREEKVAFLKRAIQEGKYSVDSETLAEKILNESLLDLIL